jgi:hypothetical protein
MMKMDVIASPSWSTASFGEAANTSPLELAALGEHLHNCRGSRGNLFTLRCLAESTNGFFASRFVTTLAVATLFMGVCALVM